LSLKLFIDSSVIIEGFKGSPKALLLLKELMNLNERLCINEVVVSEVVYQLCSKRNFSLEKLRKHLLSFLLLEVDETAVELMFDLIEKYNLKPNNALILATCKRYDVTHLISLNSDFKKACEGEGAVLVDSSEKLREIFS